MARSDGFEQEYVAAVAAGQRAKRHPLAVLHAEYRPGEMAIFLLLKSGVAVSIPVDRIDEVKGASPEQLATVKVSSLRDTLIWDALDVFISARGLMADLCGLVDPAAVGRKGGAAKSEAKAAAVRENGKKGGRPKKAANG